ncbi:MAG: biotin/lipoyl-binding protein, partial [Chloroflexota bacterium]
MPIKRLAAVLVLMAIAIVVGVGLPRAATQEPVQITTATDSEDLIAWLTLHTVTAGNVETVVSGLGSLEPIESLEMSFATGGRVETVYVTDGDTVYPGDVLAELNNDAFAIEHEQALLAIDNAEINLLDLVEPVSDDDIALAQAAIDSARAAYTAAITAVSPAEIEAADLQYQQAVAEYEALLDSRVMRSGGAGGGDERVALAEAEIGAAGFDMEIARLNAQNVRNSTTNPSVYVAEIREAELNYEALFVGPSEYDLQAAEIQVERAYADLYDVELEDSRTRLIATIEGEVSNLDMA